MTAVEASLVATPEEDFNVNRSRLHIRPLNPALLSTVIPPSILPSARNITYHTLQTFPERDYGFVDLPAAEAEKVKKRLHGSILKGVKARVEEARPKRREATVTMGKEEQERETDATAKEDQRRSSKRIRKDVKKQLEGVDIPNGRKVQRGWTEPKPTKHSKESKTSKTSKRQVQTSKHTEKPECLFRANLPSNAETVVSEKGSRKSKRTSQPTVVHEFATTTKYPTFLRDPNAVNGRKPVTSYVENKGWVDEEGNVIEGPSENGKKRKRAKSSDEVATGTTRKDAQDVIMKSPPGNTEEQEPSNDSTSDEATDTSSSSSGSDSEPARDQVPKMRQSPSTKKLSEPVDASDESTSSSGSSSESESLSESESESESEADDAIKSPENLESKKSKNQKSTTSSRNLSIKIPPNQSASPSPKKVHPLEALFKRPKNKEGAPGTPEGSAEPENAFSFFATDNADENDGAPEPPQTPFTKRDFFDRTMRSAAPTPDTAAPGKSFPRFWKDYPGDEDDSDDDMDAEKGDVIEPEPERKQPSRHKKEDTQVAKQPSTQKGFEELFWEKRGESNRIWKRRRREAGKEKRKRENNRLRGRGE
ncbi:MAG: hypothetical protein M4579_003998 [Chaenotheca gracillima]|nr:MAG: hypothetical protein M4579_003998 [Chaenotheca gracillima]